MATESLAADCPCVFCAGLVDVCSGTKLHGVCSCGYCCENMMLSFGMTEQDLRDEQDAQDRIAEWAERVLSIEIELAEMDWLSLADLTSFLSGTRIITEDERDGACEKATAAAVAVCP
ncbi:hypothetical protein [Pseudomonas sp. EMN2]|uniref:hypothetical protein n=1 Tax=Pseudomonas sp. EMN2 TaxID=2615212 RepID=UPI00129A4E7D|nr:hypothetical protein [Pseudomonas sp. EMN2]